MSSWHLIIFNHILDKVRPWQWLVISSILRRYTSKKNISEILINKTFTKVFVLNKTTLSSLSHEFKDFVKKSHFTTGDTYIEDWLIEKFNVSIEYDTLNKIIGSDHKEKTVVALFASRPSISYMREVYQAIQLKRKGIPVIAFVKDSFVPTDATIIAIFVALTGGVSVLLPNSKVEAVKYGYPFPVAPIFWIWPESRYLPIKKNNAEITWGKRINLFIEPNPGVDILRRSQIGELLKSRVIPGDYASFRVGGLPTDEYLELLSTSKLYFTTCLVQPQFLYGPKLYKDRMTTETITGQVWEALASGCVLITNKCQALHEFGFFAFEHYLDFDALISGQEKFPSDSRLKNIAESGNLLFEQLISKKVDF